MNLKEKLAESHGKIILNCDIMDGFKQLDDGCVDLIVTSPPY